MIIYLCGLLKLTFDKNSIFFWVNYSDLPSLRFCKMIMHHSILENDTPPPHFLKDEVNIEDKNPPLGSKVFKIEEKNYHFAKP